MRACQTTYVKGDAGRARGGSAKRQHTHRTSRCRVAGHADAPPAWDGFRRPVLDGILWVLSIRRSDAPALHVDPGLLWVVAAPAGGAIDRCDGAGSQRGDEGRMTERGCAGQDLATPQLWTSCAGRAARRDRRRYIDSCRWIFADQAEEWALLDGDGGAGAFEGSPGLVGGLPVDLLQDGIGGAVDEVLCLFQAKARQ